MDTTNQSFSKDFPKVAFYGVGAVTITMIRAFLKNEIPFTILCKSTDRLNILKKPILFQKGNGKLEALELKNRLKPVQNCIDRFDWIVLGCKQDHLPIYMEDTKEFLSDEGRWIFIQNGFPESRFREKSMHIVGGVIGWNTKLISSEGNRDQIHYQQTNPGALILGPIGKFDQDSILPRESNDTPVFYSKLDFWKVNLAPHIPVILTENLTGFRWHKLGINCIINGLAASKYQSLGPLFLDRKNRFLAIHLLTEVQMIMDKLQIREEVVPGSISIRKLSHGKAGLPTLLKHLVLIFLGLKYFQIRTSMVQDLDKQIKTEISYINGYVVKSGRELGIPTPYNQAILEQVEARERTYL
ncbi:MAG: ketopantoate reductase family protein [Leptospira sp.]|nr:ketopantoate reductase family protein [Leptospira sp.]